MFSQFAFISNNNVLYITVCVETDDVAGTALSGHLACSRVRPTQHIVERHVAVQPCKNRKHDLR